MIMSKFSLLRQFQGILQDTIRVSTCVPLVRLCRILMRPYHALNAVACHKMHETPPQRIVVGLNHPSAFLPCYQVPSRPILDLV